MNKYLPLLLLILLCTSCKLIKVKPTINGLYSRYDKTNEEYPGLLITDNSKPVCDLQYNTEKPEVYVVNGLQLKECVAQYDDAIVYIWDPHCPGEQCFSPTLLQKYCNEKNVELFVVAEYYDGKELTQYYDIKRPLFGIDTKHYCSNFINKYAKCFETDLTDVKYETGRMLYFKKGEYMGKATIEFEGETASSK